MLPDFSLATSSDANLAAVQAPPVFASPRPGSLERMPKWLICIPLVLQWLGLALYHRSLTLPSAANPSITSGGLIGEGKLEYFQGMGQIAHTVTATYAALPTDKDISSESIEKIMVEAGLSFPIIAKPDLGLCGHGVRRIDTMPELLAYGRSFPRNETIVLQRYLPEQGEAGIFYVRDKETGQGRLLGLALRYFPSVTGDGVRSLGSLMNDDARLSRLVNARAHDRVPDIDRVPARGELVRLSTIGSTRVGGLYRDGNALITPKLSRAIDAIARDMPDFHFGRFDVRFEDLVQFADGSGFTIIEINGAGSEAIHAWDPDTGLTEGFRIILAKQKILFRIGAQMRRAGIRPIGIVRLARLFLRQQRLLALYPPSN